MKLLKELLEAQASAALKNTIFYHGTLSKTAVDSILKHGLDPAYTEIKYGSSKSKMRPQSDKVYITSKLNYAMIYALRWGFLWAQTIRK